MGNCNFIGGKVTNNVATRGGFGGSILVGQFQTHNWNPRMKMVPSFFLFGLTNKKN
jgi:hypothetical protein